ncbi:MAG: YafY family protein [Cyclobacteriaceae bacterium]|nr:YafY family transcriptional regulator [Cyclobacteriaceae bacterium]
MNRVDRLMGILTVLQSHRFVTAEKIADKFDISVRTVYRDIKALGEIGIPVSFEVNKGYFIVQGYFLPPVSFTPEEANALVLVSSLADRFADRSIAKHSSNALQKIRSVLRSGQKEHSETLSSKIRVLNPQGYSVDYLVPLQKAITEFTIVEIEYTDAQKQITTREIEPIGMIYYTEQWHLIAWCWLRNDYRDFIVNQINKLRVKNITFRKKDHISLEDHMNTWGIN